MALDLANLLQPFVFDHTTARQEIDPILFKRPKLSGDAANIRRSNWDSCSIANADKHEQKTKPRAELPLPVAKEPNNDSIVQLCNADANTKSHQVFKSNTICKLLASSVDPLLFTFIYLNCLKNRAGDAEAHTQAADTDKMAVMQPFFRQASVTQKNTDLLFLASAESLGEETVKFKDKLAMCFHLVSEIAPHRLAFKEARIKQWIAFDELESRITNSQNKSKLPLPVFMALCEFAQIPVVCVLGTAYLTTACCDLEVGAGDDVAALVNGGSDSNVHVIFCTNFEKKRAFHKKPAENSSSGVKAKKWEFTYAYGGKLTLECCKYISENYHFMPSIKKPFTAISKLKIGDVEEICTRLRLACQNVATGKKLTKVQMHANMLEYFDQL